VVWRRPWGKPLRTQKFYGLDAPSGGASGATVSAAHGVQDLPSPPQTNPEPAQKVSTPLGVLLVTDVLQFGQGGRRLGSNKKAVLLLVDVSHVIGVSVVFFEELGFVLIASMQSHPFLGVH